MTSIFVTHTDMLIKTAVRGNSCSGLLVDEHCVSSLPMILNPSLDLQTVDEAAGATSGVSDVFIDLGKELSVLHTLLKETLPSVTEVSLQRTLHHTTLILFYLICSTLFTRLKDMTLFPCSTVTVGVFDCRTPEAV